MHDLVVRGNPEYEILLDGTHFGGSLCIEVATTNSSSLEVKWSRDFANLIGAPVTVITWDCHLASGRRRNQNSSLSRLTVLSWNTTKRRGIGARTIRRDIYAHDPTSVACFQKGPRWKRQLLRSCELHTNEASTCAISIPSVLTDRISDAGHAKYWYAVVVDQFVILSAHLTTNDPDQGDGANTVRETTEFCRKSTTRLKANGVKPVVSLATDVNYSVPPLVDDVTGPTVAKPLKSHSQAMQPFVLS